ncbi:MAG: ATP synthase F1 subunit epsilon [Proteobacteria bacterium]|nr:ATP synthase F1 subunit epsilon [Pseudomonadota bacterium]
MEDFAKREPFQFDLISPESIFASEKAAMVLMNGDKGEFGVLKGHSPVVSSVKPGVLSIFQPDGEVRKVFVSSGFANISEELCSVLVENAINVSDLNKEELTEELTALKAEMKSKEDEDDFAKLIDQRAIIEAKIRAVEA